MDVCGKYLVVGGFDEYLRIYDLKRQREVGILDSHIGTITSIHSHGSIVISCAEDGLIKAWKMKEFGLLHTLKEHKDTVNDIAVHSSGKILVSVSKDQRLIIWNLISATKVYVLNLKYSMPRYTHPSLTQLTDYYFLRCLQGLDYWEVCDNYVRLLVARYQLRYKQGGLRAQVRLEAGVRASVAERLHSIRWKLRRCWRWETCAACNANWLKLFVCHNSLDNNGFIFIFDITTKKSISFRAHDSRVKKLQIANIDGLDIIITISTNGEIHLFDALVILHDITEISES